MCLCNPTDLTQNAGVSRNMVVIFVYKLVLCYLLLLLLVFRKIKESTFYGLTIDSSKYINTCAQIKSRSTTKVSPTELT